MIIEELNLNVSDLIEEFIEDERELFEVNISELTISNRLGRKFEIVASGWNVDCEYNRDMSEIKRLKYALAENGNIEEHNVVPDIIIHHRQTNHNLLAVEVKKVTNRENRFKDVAKLRAFREQLGYKYTLFVDFQTGDNPSIASMKFKTTE